jgi:hypothetical protein
LAKLSAATNYKINVLGHSQGGGSNVSLMRILCVTSFYIFAIVLRLLFSC